MRTSCLGLIVTLVFSRLGALAENFTTYASESAFVSALGGSLTRTNEFSEMESGNILHPVTWTDGGLACSINSDPLLQLYGLPGALSTYTPAARIVVQFTSQNVRAAGGQIYTTDDMGVAAPGPIQIVVAGGPTLTLTNAATPLPFAGVVSSGPLLTNFTLVSLNTNLYVTLDHLIVSEGKPWLAISPTTNHGIILRWPAPATGYVLQNRGLAPGSVWAAVSATAVRTGEFWTLALPTPADGALFRLRRP